MANGQLPKTNMFGNYSKKSMNSYIFEINEKNQEEQQRLSEKLEDSERLKEELQGRLNAMQGDIAGWEAKCREFEQKAAHLSDDLVAKESDIFAIKQKNSDLQNTIEKQTAELARAHEQLAEKDAEIEQLMAENERLALQPAPVEAAPAAAEAAAGLEDERRELDEKRRELEEERREVEEKRREIEVAARQISRVFTSAQADAEAIMESARRQAASITGEAQQKSRALLEQAQHAADQAMGGVFEKFERFKAEFAHVQKAVGEAVSGINAGMASVQEAVVGVRTDAPPVQYTPPEQPRPPEERSPLTNEILSQYGITPERKEFFR